EPELTGPLRELVARSALPLRAVETVFAVDSSGFSVSKFVRWMDEKYGVERSGHDWVKAHICTGVKTNVVTAVEIKDRDANDCPLLPPLVRATAENFTQGRDRGQGLPVGGQRRNHRLAWWAAVHRPEPPHD